MISRNLNNLCRLLKEQYQWKANPSTFRRTYAGRLLRSDGAFSWVMSVSNEKGSCFEVGSCQPLKDFARRDTIIEFSNGWSDIELFAYTPEQFKKISDCRKEQNDLLFEKYLL